MREPQENARFNHRPIIIVSVVLITVKILIK